MTPADVSVAPMADDSDARRFISNGSRDEHVAWFQSKRHAIVVELRERLIGQRRFPDLDERRPIAITHFDSPDPAARSANASWSMWSLNAENVSVTLPAHGIGSVMFPP